MGQNKKDRTSEQVRADYYRWAFINNDNGIKWLLNYFMIICGKDKTIKKVQLELPERIIKAYKEKSKDSRYSAKQIMENMLINWIDGVSAS